jgi:hypothetical protein
VQRLLAEKFNLPGLSQSGHTEGQGKDKDKERDKKGLTASRRGTQQSCVQVSLGQHRNIERRLELGMVVFEPSRQHVTQCIIHIFTHK